MKKYFSKSIFRDKSFIKMVCFTIVLLLVLILGNSFGYVSAETVIDDNYVSSGWGDDYDDDLNYPTYCDSSIYDSNVDTYHLSFNYVDDLDFYDLKDVMSSNMPSEYRDAIVEHPIEPDLSNYPSYLIYPTGYSTCKMYLFPSSECYFAFNTVWIDYNSWDYNNVPWLEVDFTFDSSGNLLSSGGRYYYLNNPRTSGGYLLFGAIGNDAVTNVAFCNFPILGVYSDYAYDFNMESQISGYLNGQNDYYTNINYLIADGNYTGIGTNNNGLGGSNPSNYMYADDADWILNNYSGNIWTNYNSMSVSFTSSLNQYIRDEISSLEGADLSDYYINFDFYSYVEFYYYGVSQDVSLDSNITENFGVTTQTTIPGNGYYWSCTYKTPTDSHANLFKNINAKTFADGGYTKIYGFNTLFKYLSPNGTFGDSPITITLSDLCNCTSSGDLLFNDGNTSIGTNTLLNQIKDNWKKFNIVCMAKIYYDDGNVSYETGSYSEDFNLLTGDSNITDSSMLTNYNPYNSNTDDVVSIPSSSSGGSSTSSASTGNVTQTVTVTNSGAEYIPSIISKLIPTSLGDTGTGLVDTFSDMAQTNGWISVMASTVPAIPSTIWVYLTNYLGITLYLLACAFVLRLILDLL